LWEGYQVLRDYQHSVDTLGRVVGGGSDRIPMSFDAWGKRRNTDWSADPADARFADIHWTQRGYTDHAHLDNVKLIHMNGRVEDPILGRMLSPDLVLGVLSSPQTLNPYSYALNNPLSYTDPSGYFLHGLFRKFFYPFKQFVRDLPGNGNFGRLVIAAVASYFTTGAAYGAYLDAAAVGETATAAEIATANIVGYSAGGAVGGGISTGTLKGAVIGGLSGAAFGGVDVAFGSEYTLGRVAADATVGGASARLQGASFGRGFLFAGIGSGAEYAYRAAVGYGTEWGPGGPAQPKESLARPIKGADNVGFTLRNGIDDPALTSSESVFGEGAPLMRLANHVPGINAVAGLHDIWQRQTAILGGDLLRNVLNVPGMAVAVGGTLPALVRGVPVVDYGVDD
jgi:RHS repeat-associated protein